MHPVYYTAGLRWSGGVSKVTPLWGLVWGLAETCLGDDNSTGYEEEGVRGCRYMQVNLRGYVLPNTPMVLVALFLSVEFTNQEFLCRN